MKKILSIILYFFCLPLILQSQAQLVKTFNTYTGLSNNNVQCICQDSSGYTWVGTDYGLNRFNGSSFDLFTHNPSDSCSLPDNEITCLYYSSNNVLWVGTSNGLASFNPRNETFTCFQNLDRNYLSLSNNYISAISEDKHGQLWVGTIAGLNIMNENGEFTRHYSGALNKNTIAGDQISFIFKDKRKDLWIASTNGGLTKAHKLNETRIVFEQINLISSKTEEFNSRNIVSITQDTNNHLWIASENGLIFIINPDDYQQVNQLNLFSNNTLSPIKVLCMKHHSGKVYVGLNNNSLKIIDAKTHTPVNSSFPSELITNSVAAFYFSDDGNTWIGNNEGLFLMEKNYQTTPNESERTINSLIKEKTLSYITLGKEYYVGTHAGIVYHFDNNDLLIKKITLSEAKEIYTFQVDDNNNLWVGTDNGLYYIHPSGKYQLYDFKNSNYKDKKENMIHSILFSDGLIYLGTSAGLRIMDLEKNESLLFSPIIIDLEEKTQGFSFNSLYKDSQGHYWMNNKNFLFEFDTLVMDFTRYNIDTTELASDFIINSFTPMNDTLWLATNKGIHLFDIEDKRFRRIQYHNMNHDNYRTITIESGNTFWLCSDKYITRFTPRNNDFYLFDAIESINNTGLSEISSSHRLHNRLFLSGKKGLTVFSPKQLVYCKNTLYLDLSGLKVINTPDKKFLLSETNEVVLNHDETYFSIDFVLVHYKKPEQIQYAYKMEGLENSWIYVNTNRSAIFTHTPPGRYVFQAKAATSNGVWYYSKKVQVIIKKPYWQTTFFIVVLIILFIGLTYLIYYIRTSSIKKTNIRLNKEVEERVREINEQKEELKKLNASKDKLFSVIGHDLKNPFNIIAGFTKLLLDNFETYYKEKEKLMEITELINSSAESTRELLNNILQWAKSNTSKIKFSPEIISCDKIISKSIQFLSIPAKTKGVTLRQIKSDFTMMGDVDMIETIIRNLISNALKFSNPNGEIIVFCKETNNNMIAIYVQDNGIGIPDEVKPFILNSSSFYSTKGTEGEQGTGIGLILCREFAKKNNGTLTFTSEVNKGTTFVLTLP